jgi:hypothetical protein
MPRLMGEPVSLNTSSGRAKKVKELPRLEMVWPSQKRPKSPDNSQPRRPLASEVMPAILACRPDTGQAIAVQAALDGGRAW